jgi:molybdenum cofactor cytidylyltransferase
MHTPTEPRIAGIILAAGASTRFGSTKQRARLGERTMLEAVVQVALASGLDPVLSVVPPSFAVPTDAVAVPNPEPERGLSHSLQLGIRAVPTDAVAAVILLGDQPTLDSAVVRRLVAARDPRHPIVATQARGVLAPPVLVERDAFEIVDDLSGDVGLRRWLAANHDRVTSIPVEAHPPDVDTPEDLAALDGD